MNQPQARRPSDPTWVLMWDQRFRDEGHAYGVAPSMYLREKSHLLRPGQTALTVADGGGRNAVWLAEQGLAVTVVDLSGEGIARARELAAIRGVSLCAIHADVLAWECPIEAFDLVVAIYFHLPPDARRCAHQKMATALKPGGHLIIEGFHVDQLHFRSGGPRDASMLFDEALLREDFDALEIVEVRTERVTLNESRLHSGDAMLVRLHARCPDQGARRIS